MDRVKGAQWRTLWGRSKGAFVTGRGYVDQFPPPGDVWWRRTWRNVGKLNAAFMDLKRVYERVTQTRDLLEGAHSCMKWMGSCWK